MSGYILLIPGTNDEVAAEASPLPLNLQGHYQGDKQVTISSWDDQSSAGVDCSQDTATNQPTVGSITGKDAPHFDGVDNFYDLDSDFTATGEFTVAIVVDRDTETVGSLIGNTSNWIQINSATTLTVRVNGVNKVFTFAAGTFSINTPHVILVTRDGSDDIKAYCDGVESTTGTLNGTGNFVCATIGQANAASYYDGLIGEIVLSTAASAPAAVSNLSDHLFVKWSYTFTLMRQTITIEGGSSADATTYDGDAAYPMTLNPNTSTYHTTIFAYDNPHKAIGINGKVMAAGEFLRRTRPVVAVNNTYYCDPYESAGGGQTGEIDDPMHPDDAFATATHADHIIFREGSPPKDYHVGDYSVALDDLKLSAYPGESPWFNGSLLVTESWASRTVGDDTVYSISNDFDSAGGGMLHAELTPGVADRIPPYASVQAIQDSNQDPTAGENTGYGWTMSEPSGDLDLILPGDVDPNTVNIWTSQDFKYFILNTRKGFEVSGLNFRRYGAHHVAGSGGSQPRVIICDSATTAEDLFIHDCIFEDNHGIAVYAVDCDYVDIRNNIFRNNQDKYIDWQSLKNTDDPGITDGTWLTYEGSNSLKINGCNYVDIRGNSFSESMDLCGTNGSANYMDIYDNTISKGYGETLNLETPITHCRVFRNAIDKPNRALGFATMETGPVWIVNNKFTECGYLPQPVQRDSVSGESWRLYGMTKFHSGGSPDLGQLLVFHNLFSSEDSTPNWYTWMAGWEYGTAANTDPTSTKLRNNIIIGYDRIIKSDDPAAATADDWDYDIFYQFSPLPGNHNDPYRWDNGTTVENHATLAAFKTHSGMETNGLELDPVIDATGMQTVTPAKMGENIPGITGNPVTRIANTLIGYQTP